MRKNKRESLKDMLWHIDNIKKNGYKVNDDLYINTIDYKINEDINTPLKDLRAKELNRWKKEDPEYYKHNTASYWEEIKGSDILYGDWWTVLYKNNIYFISISTPYLYSLEDYSLASVISSHFLEIFPESLETNPLVFRKISKNPKSKIKLYSLNNRYENKKSYSDLIRNYVESNSNNDIVLNDYRKLMNDFNIESTKFKDYTCSFTKPSINSFTAKINGTKYKALDLDITIPLFYDKSMLELLKTIFLDDKYNLKNKNLSEDSFIETLPDKSDFLSQFKIEYSYKYSIRKLKRYKNK